MAVQISGNDITVPRDTTVTRNLTVGGVLTYEDVTNVDSIGIVTARAGVLVGSGITLSKDGDIFATGVTTTGSLVSNGVIKVPDGSTSAPSITAASDTNSGLYFAAADALGLVVGGSRKLLANSSGITVNNGDLTIDDKIIHQSDTDTTIRFPAADTITAETGGSERLRIDSSGRVMINTDTEGFATYGDQFTIANSGHCGMTIRSGSSSDGNIYFSDGTSGADEVRGFVEYNHSSNYMQLGTNGSAKLQLNNNGNLFLRSATANYLVMGSSGDATSGGVTNNMNWIRGNSTNTQLNCAGGFISFEKSGTEIGRFQGDDFLVGTTNASSSTGVGLKLNYDDTNPTFNCVINQSSHNHSFYHLYNTNATHNAYRFYVQVNGGIANYQSNNVDLSDERMKKNITNMGSVYDTFKKFTFKDFNYIDDEASESKKHGLIAQDVETIDSDLITEDFKIAPDSEGNDVYRKALKTEQFMMIGMKALQEAMTKIETLEAEVAALKGS